MLDEGCLFKLVLVRHGQQADRLNHDSPLSDLGHRQAAQVGAHLGDEPVTAVFSSQLERANDTGLAIAAHHDMNCAVDTRFEEIHIARDVPEGKRLREVISGDELAERNERFIQTRRWEEFALSETGDELRKRVAAGLQAIRDSEPSGTVVVACHGGVVNAVIANELEVEADYFCKIAHASVTRLRVGEQHMIIEAVNETHHLTNGLLTY